MSEKPGGAKVLASFMEELRTLATEFFAIGEVEVPVLHFLTDTTMGVMPLVPLPGLEPAHMARLVVGYYDPPVAAVLAEGWATSLALPREIDEALAGKRPWSEVHEQVQKRLAPALRHYPRLAEALSRQDVQTLHRLSHDLTYAWHDATMGPVVRGEKSLKQLPPSLRHKIMCISGEDRDGHSEMLLWRIEQRDGRRHFVPESLEGAEQFATRWRPLYIVQEMAARERLPTVLLRPRVRDLCREQLRPYKVVETVNFMEISAHFGGPISPYKH